MKRRRNIRNERIGAALDRAERSLSALDRAVAGYAYERALAFLQKAPKT